LPLERCIAEELDGEEGEVIQTFTVDATVDGVSKEGAVTGKIFKIYSLCFILNRVSQAFN